MSPAVNDENAPIWAVRLEAKVDVAIAQQGAAIDTLNRDLDAHKQDSNKAHDELDSRVDVLERSNFVTFKSLALTVAGVLTGVATFIGIIERLQQ